MPSKETPEDCKREKISLSPGSWKITWRKVDLEIESLITKTTDTGIGFHSL